MRSGFSACSPLVYKVTTRVARATETTSAQAPVTRDKSNRPCQTRGAEPVPNIHGPSRPACPTSYNSRGRMCCSDRATSVSKTTTDGGERPIIDRPALGVGRPRSCRANLASRRRRRRSSCRAELGHGGMTRAHGHGINPMEAVRMLGGCKDRRAVRPWDKTGVGWAGQDPGRETGSGRVLRYPRGTEAFAGCVEGRLGVAVVNGARWPSRVAAGSLACSGLGCLILGGSMSKGSGWCDGHD